MNILHILNIYIYNRNPVCTLQPPIDYSETTIRCFQYCWLGRVYILSAVYVVFLISADFTVDIIVIIIKDIVIIIKMIINIREALMVVTGVIVVVAVQ